MRFETHRVASAVAAAGLVVATAVAAAPAPAPAPSPMPEAPDAAEVEAGTTTFSMRRSSGAVAADCLPGAGADVTVKERGQVEVMTVKAHDLPANTEFDLFITQVPDAPFGVSWYQADLETDQYGDAKVRVRGRFSVETFTLALGGAPAPDPHDGDATTNPAFEPVHSYHLGLWFNSPDDSADAGCGDGVTPFNGEHDAGGQALSTRHFPDEEGPLRQIGS